MVVPSLHIHTFIPHGTILGIFNGDHSWTWLRPGRRTHPTTIPAGTSHFFWRVRPAWRFPFALPLPGRTGLPRPYRWALPVQRRDGGWDGTAALAAAPHAFPHRRKHFTDYTMGAAACHGARGAATIAPPPALPNDNTCHYLSLSPRTLPRTWTHIPCAPPGCPTAGALPANITYHELPIYTMTCLPCFQTFGRKGHRWQAPVDHWWTLVARRAGALLLAPRRLPCHPARCAGRCWDGAARQRRT